MKSWHFVFLSITVLGSSAWNHWGETDPFHRLISHSLFGNTPYFGSSLVARTPDINRAISDEDINPIDFRNLLRDILEIPVMKLFSIHSSCDMCKELVNIIHSRGYRHSKVPKFICQVYYLMANLSFPTFCSHMAKQNLPVLKYVFNNIENVDPELVCTIVLQTENCTYSKPALSWTTRIPRRTLPKYPKHEKDPNKRPLKILHLTGPHVSFDYEENGAVDCGAPLCCKKGLGNKSSGRNAGYWGEYTCDIPPWLYGDTLQQISNTHKDLDLIYFTGGIRDHTLWKSSHYAMTEAIFLAFKSLKATFPDTPLFPVIGNHEPSTQNQFAPNKPDIYSKGLSTKLLYIHFAAFSQWWLPENTLKTIQSQGYYAHSVSDRLKIIGLNNNVCYKFNWWLLLETKFLDEQLQFLVKELEDSEKNEQYVHILTHIPVGNNDCIKPWEASYNIIVQRYAHIIKGQFYGHTGTDGFKIFYDRFRSPINAAFNGANLSPYQNYNPSYKIVHVHPDTMDVVDIETYYFNLTEANLSPDRSPNWKKLYSMKEDYDLPDLSPKSLDGLVDALFTDTELMDNYWKYSVRLADPSLNEKCDKKCLQEMRCNIVTTQSGHPEKRQCKQPTL
ncbi:sphingomyelin phosphodiesterase 1-like isoform X1 [Diabrotica virgifera virgifera]|uniref:Sphingomyelin phosphodiesterase n=1 Tax=Diabrotica virgifera virgifera TaxID=50390 RepID=A0ABM5L5C5_DIAVI|nr:sphingomyelin phosphodiesterase 1-like isoform X1 [Diabrotica virgifera virgifera]